MPISERMSVVKSLKFVDDVCEFDDSDGSAISLLKSIKKQYSYAEIVFANGGDRTDQNIPEIAVTGIKFVFGMGGFNKANSSSWILEEWKAPKTERPWGYYRVLHSVNGTKVKELTIEPGQSLSLQRHHYRSEHWHVSEGRCCVKSTTDSGYALPTKTLEKHDHFSIKTKEWHQLHNPFELPCKIVEIQYGTVCEEDDIERR
jgi:mannose-6-phosphate isomerase-like protein (cupin superfamily)